MRSDELLELRDDLLVAAELELGLDPPLQQVQAQLLEPTDLRSGERQVGELAERWAAPEREAAA